MKQVIIAALENNNIKLKDTDGLFDIAWYDQNDTTIYYKVIYYLGDFEVYHLTEISLSLTTLKADFTGIVHFVGAYKECKEEFILI